MKNTAQVVKMEAYDNVNAEQNGEGRPIHYWSKAIIENTDNPDLNLNMLQQVDTEDRSELYTMLCSMQHLTSYLSSYTRRHGHETL